MSLHMESAHVPQWLTLTLCGKRNEIKTQELGNECWREICG